MDDRHLEDIIGNLLRAGVLLAAAVVLIGGVLYLMQHHAERASYHAFAFEGSNVTTLPGILRSASHLSSEGLIQFGLLLLIATPVARVAMAVAGFYLEKDHLYVWVSLIVLGILLFSLLHAS